MRRPENIPAAPGVFVILHEASKHAYVHETVNLKERAMIWASLFKAFDRDGTPIRVRAWPRDLAAPGSEWEFRFSADPDVTVDCMQAFLTRSGWAIIRSRRSETKLYTVQGVEGTLLDHCRRLGIANWSAVYKRVQRGATPEEALGLVPYPRVARSEPI